MFEPQDQPRVFYLPPGVDFSRAFVDGFRARSATLAPLDVARAEIWVNTNRTLFRLSELFAAHRPLLLPKMLIIEDLAKRPFPGLQPAVPRLERILDIAALIRKFIAADPGFAHPSAAFDLANSVARLFAEFQEEQVDASALADLDVTDQSGHWQRALTFLTTITAHYGPGQALPESEGRQRAAADALIAKWQITPPNHPVLVAGSTGSRGTTTRVMEAVAHLPQGAIILPGLDPDMPAAVWQTLAEDDAHQDHPQYRFARLLARLQLDPKSLQVWDAAPPLCPSRNRLISLALRPPPLTDQWRDEALLLTDMTEALDGLSLIAADGPRTEAIAIAYALRRAAGEGKTTALITPDRTLARRVSSALARWNIAPDDTAGEPLGLTPAGRFTRQIADLMCRTPSAEKLIALLK
ncbi:MAG: double-strand break repair protein AddB, partial [Deltaproteobacteria bacterium]